MPDAPPEGPRNSRTQSVPTPGGHTLAVWTSGAGQPLIAPPPGPWITLAQTRDVIAEIGPDTHPWNLPGFETIRYDVRGLGDSSGRPDSSLAAQLEDLAAVIDATTPGPVVLIGYGHAGPAAIAYTRAHPERVRLLLLWCSYANAATGYFQRRRVNAILRILPMDWALFANTISREVLGWHFPQAKRFTEIFRRGAPGPRQIASAMGQMATIDVSHYLADLRVPTVVCQRRDCPAPSLETATRLAGAIPGAELVIFPGEAPLAFTDRPQLVQRVVLEAIRRLDKPATEATEPLQCLVDRDGSTTHLTPRERETLSLVAEGLDNRAIAARMQIAPATVKNHLSAILAKLEAPNRTDAVRRARERGEIA